MIPNYVVIHHSATADSKTVSWQAIRRYHMNDLRWSDVGYHFGLERIDNRYEVLLGRMPDRAGAHCKQQSMNFKSLGMCFVGNFDFAPPDAAQWELGVRLCASICNVLNLDVSHVVGHRDYASYKTCPGRLFDMGQFRSDILLEMKR